MVSTCFQWTLTFSTFFKTERTNLAQDNLLNERNKSKTWSKSQKASHTREEEKEKEKGEKKEQVKK